MAQILILFVSISFHLNMAISIPKTQKYFQIYQNLVQYVQSERKVYFYNFQVWILREIGLFQVGEKFTLTICSFRILVPRFPNAAIFIYRSINSACKYLFYSFAHFPLIKFSIRRQKCYIRACLCETSLSEVCRGLN